jgi:AmpD protein
VKEKSLTMRINKESGLLEAAKLCLSPHCDERDAAQPISLIVIHNISLPPGEFGGNHIEAFFCNQLDTNAHDYFSEIEHLKVSSHLLIKRTGELLQFVPFHQRAWHAGVSSYEGCEQCNDFSIGIELEGTDEIPYEEVQYKVLAAIVQQLILTYPTLSREHIAGHSSISPGRKTDPGPSFNWAHLQGLLDSL